MIKRLIAASALALLFALGGCVSSLSPEQRLYCLDLTEKSYAFVPECKTEQDCFNALQGKFFSFGQSVFSNELQERLYNYKNNVALSWLYFNNARQSISKIHEICNGNSGIAELPFHLNELNHNMGKAFEFSSQANNESFAIILLEYSNLENDGIDFAKEEPLFGDFAVIADNLNSISQKSICEGKQNYSCFYLSQANSFSLLIAQTGFEQAVLSESNIFAMVSPNSKTVGKYLETEFKIPVISPALEWIVNYFAAFFAMRDSVPALQKTPAFELMQSYNAFMGTENSCLQKFSAIMESDALHRAELEKESNELDLKAEQGLSAVQESIDSLLSSNYASFDENFFQKLYAGLSNESGIAAQQYSIQDFGELNSQATARLSDLKQTLFEIRQKSALKEISLGEKLAGLKQLNAEIELLQQNIGYLSNEVLDGLLVLCNERSGFIEKQLQEAVLPEDYLLTASDLRARAEFKQNLFDEASSTEEKLLLCSQMVEEFENFSLALKDFEEYKLQEQLSLQGCFSSVELLLQYSEAPGFQIDDFKLRYLEMQSIEKPYPDIAAVQRICLSLKTGLEGFIKSQPIVREIETGFLLSKKILGAIQSASIDQNFSREKMESLEKQLAGFAEYFSGNDILLERALPVLPDLEKGLSEFNSSLQEELAGLPKQSQLFSLQNSPPKIADANNEAEQANATLEKISVLESIVSLAEEKQSALAKLFSSVSDEQLISAKYVAPISKTELNSLKLKLAALRAFLGKKSLQDFALLAGQGDYEGALKKSKDFVQQLDEKLPEAETIGARLDEAADALKEDAVVAYNSAAGIFNNSNGSQEAQDALEKAKQQLLDSSYLESIASSKNALELLSKQPAIQQQLDIPVFVWPLAGSAALIAIVRYKKNKGEKQQKELLKIIEKNW